MNVWVWFLLPLLFFLETRSYVKMGLKKKGLDCSCWAPQPKTDGAVIKEGGRLEFRFSPHFASGRFMSQNSGSGPCEECWGKTPEPELWTIGESISSWRTATFTMDCLHVQRCVAEPRGRLEVISSAAARDGNIYEWERAARPCIVNWQMIAEPYPLAGHNGGSQCCWTRQWRTGTKMWWVLPHCTFPAYDSIFLEGAILSLQCSTVTAHHRWGVARAG